MTSPLLNIGKSALNAAQVGINTAGHNIANAGTAGFHRQTVVQASALAQSFGFGFVGQGTQIATIQRVYSQHLVNQQQQAQTTQSGLAAHYAELRKINDLVADPAAGVAPALQDFFAATQALTANPASLPARQAMLSAGQALASRIQGLDARFAEIEQGVNSQLQSSVASVNALASQLASLNDAIARAARSAGQPPNDLLDQRDQLVLELNREIRATVVRQGDDYNVFIGNGQPLVVGSTASTLAAVPAADNPARLDIALRAQSGDAITLGETSLSGGRIGGLLEFRSQSLTEARNALGRVALGLASTFNAQHMAGFDLTGAAGDAFFAVAGPAVVSSTLNTGSGVITASLASASALTTGDYRLRFDGAAYTVTRLSDGQTSSFSTLPQTVDGFTIDLASGALAAGDSFLIRPTAQAASSLAVALTDPAAIAAAGSAGAVGDNTNLLALAALQTANTLANGSATYLGAYGQMVSLVGNKTRELEVTSAAAGRLLASAEAAVQSESGVNLDEEAAQLLRYQQAYQAAAKVMQIANDLFSTLISISR